MPFHHGGFRSGLSTLFFLGDFSHRKIPKEFAWKQAKKIRNILRIFLEGPTSCKDEEILEGFVAGAGVIFFKTLKNMEKFLKIFKFFKDFYRLWRGSTRNYFVIFEESLKFCKKL